MDLDRPDVSIVTSGHDVADARLHRIAAALLRAGLSVEVLGLGDGADAPPEAVARTRPRGSRSRRALAALTLPWQARGRVLLVLDPDLVPSASARRLAARRLVVDVHEDYLALLDDRAWAGPVAGLAARALVRASTALTRRADLTVVADTHVPPDTARRRLVVRNLPDGGYLPPPSERAAVPRAIYIGDVRRSRGLAVMLEAVAAAPPWTLDVVGPVAPADQEWLDGWLARSTAADRVRLHGRLPPSAAWQLAVGGWAGLALLDDTPAFREAMPTKLYEYLGSGLPILVTPLPRMRQLVEESGAGAVVTDAAAAAATLRDWAAHPNVVEALRASARRWGEEQLYGPSGYDELAAQVRMLARPDQG